METGRLKRKVYGFLTLVVLLTVLGYLLQDLWHPGETVTRAQSEEGREPEAEAEVIPVEVVEVRRGPISSHLDATATLRPNRQVGISARSDGRVEVLAVEEGDFVEENQLLCRLDDTQLKIRQESARQKLAQAGLQLEKAQIRREKTATQIENTREDYTRYRKLFEEKLVSEREMAQLGYRVEELEHDMRVSTSETRELNHKVEELEAEIEQVALEISRTEVRAPFSGYVTGRMINVGQTVRNMETLLQLADFTPLYADVYLSEKDAYSIRAGQSATLVLGADGAVRASARVARISPVVDQGTGTVKITLLLNGPSPAFKPGAFVRVDINTDTRQDAVLIPRRAVVEEGDQTFVYLVEGRSARKQAVRLGYDSGPDVEVVQGIPPGSRVIVAGQGALKEGAAVRVITPPATSTG